MKKLNKKTFAFLAIILAGSFFSIQSIKAQLLWSESFTGYTQGQNLNTVNGWDYQDVSNTGYKAMQTGTAVTYSHLISSPGYFVGGGGWTSAGIKLPVTSGTMIDTYWADGEWQMMGYKAASTVNNTIWISFLVRPDTNTDGFKIGFMSQNIAWYINDSFIEVKNSGSVWSLSVDKGATTISTGVASTLGQTYLMVVKLTFGAASTAVSLYVNPTLDVNNTIPSTPSASGVTAAKTTFKAIPMYLSGDANKYSVDEFRIGVNYADVVPNDLTTGLSTSNNSATSFTAFVANGNLNMNFGKTVQNAQVTIFDVKGQQMLTSNVNGVTSTLDIQNLNKGVYIVKLLNNGKKQTAKFVK